jgi:hypothetical protein
MTLLASADVVAITDRLGAIYKRNLAVASATAATDVSGTGMTDLIADVDGLGLAKSYYYGSATIALQTAALAKIGLLDAADFATILRLLNSDVGGFTAYAVAQAGAFKYSSSFRDLCALNSITVAPLWVYNESTQTLATFAATGATTGTTVLTGTNDTSLYGPLACELIVTNDIDSSTTVTLTMLKRDGTTASKTVNLTTSDVATTVKAIGTSTDLYDDCTAIAVTGATSGDAFTVRTKILRSPAV